MPQGREQSVRHRRETLGGGLFRGGNGHLLSHLVALQVQRPQHAGCPCALSCECMQTLARR
jgi:hypothetical protein